jgi:hypothetical protein
LNLPGGRDQGDVELMRILQLKGLFAAAGVGILKFPQLSKVSVSFQNTFDPNRQPSIIVTYPVLKNPPLPTDSNFMLSMPFRQQFSSPTFRHRRVPVSKESPARPCRGFTFLQDLLFNQFPFLLVFALNRAVFFA